VWFQYLDCGALHLWVLFVMNGYKYNGALHLLHGGELFVEMKFCEFEVQRTLIFVEHGDVMNQRCSAP
jgi:hypothetical protein